MRLSEFFDGVTAPTLILAPGDPEIAGLTADSRDVRPGWLFAALPGARQDGRAFIEQAIAQGAAAILSLPGTEGRVTERASFISDTEPRRRLARMAAKFYAVQPETVVAVTGTNGKTSVADFTRQIWAGLGKRSGSLGTLGVVLDAGPEGPSLTTPDPVRLHQLLSDLAKRGVTNLAMEASSHGLDQCRLDGVRLSAAAFTNLTRDHLDYHGSMAAYRSAKLRLFDRVMGPDGTAVLNADSDAFGVFAETARAGYQRILSYGSADKADIRIISRAPRPTGQHVELQVFGTAYSVDLPLIGGFQAWNVLAALGLAIVTGTPVRQAVEALATLVGVRGRLERAATLDNGAAVYVDFAHTPDALETVLSAIRPHVDGKLWCVYGCGGDRDPGKRPMMAERVAAFADHPVLSDDNPRSEDPAEIRRQALVGAPTGTEEIGGREAAIHSAVARLGPGDVLVIAGKGHETGQEINGVKHPFDDVSVARAAVAAIRGGAA
jgi:UDP-N-acetylmuramoyl-L-alanyl-D-glutamate--2,6-diaminopimelate ligase